MKYVVELSREEVISVLDALQSHADVLENSASLQPDESIQQELMQKFKKQLFLYKKILDTLKVIE